MKLAILTTLISAATAFVAPSASVSRTPTLLREAVEEEETTESTYRGSEAISALTSSVETVFSSEDISKILPHRYPFLLVDKVVEYEAGKVCMKDRLYYVLFIIIYNVVAVMLGRKSDRIGSDRIFS